MSKAVSSAAQSTLCPSGATEWRQWLEAHHTTEPAVWLILYKKAAGRPTVSWSDAVDEALCFGWIDSIRRPLDDRRFLQFFSRRKAGSTWSKVNKQKVQRLTDSGRMTGAGLLPIAAAKADGSWAMLDEVEELILPADLVRAFRGKPGAKKYFGSLSRSVRKRALQWLVLAKRPETRQKRINELVSHAASGTRPAQLQ